MILSSPYDLMCKCVYAYLLSCYNCITYDFIVTLVQNGKDPYEVKDKMVEAVLHLTSFQIPKKLGIFQRIKSGSSVTTSTIINRIIQNR